MAPEDSSRVGVLSRVQRPLECEHYASAVGRERRADGGCGSGRPELTVPKCFGILSLSRATGWIAAGATGKRRSSPELFAWFLCVLQSFFRQVLFTYRSELKEQLCSRRDRKQGPVWEGPAWD